MDKEQNRRVQGQRKEQVSTGTKNITGDNRYKE